jgi:hypothetical protein
MVRIEVVEHHPDAVRIRVVLIGEFDHSLDPLAGSPFFGDLDVDPASQRFGSKMEVLLAVPFVVSIDTCDRSRFCQERVAFVAAKRLAGFVKADDWPLLVIWFVIDIEDVLHVVDELTIVFSGNRPVLVEMRFEDVFFRRRLTVS